MKTKGVHFRGGAASVLHRYWVQEYRSNSTYSREGIVLLQASKV